MEFKMKIYVCYFYSQFLPRNYFSKSTVQNGGAPGRPGTPGASGAVMGIVGPPTPVGMVHQQLNQSLSNPSMMMHGNHAAMANPAMMHGDNPAALLNPPGNPAAMMNGGIIHSMPMINNMTGGMNRMNPSMNMMMNPSGRWR